jgi:hypothetical protein
MKVFIVIERVCVDYHGCSDTILDIYDNREEAEKHLKVCEPGECMLSGEYDYRIDVYNVSKKYNKNETKNK